MLHLHPAKRASYLKDWKEKRRKTEKKFSKKKLQKKLARKKISCTFAPASRNASNVKNEVRKQEEHVPRHIELTAVSFERRDKRIRVIESID